MEDENALAAPTLKIIDKKGRGRKSITRRDTGLNSLASQTYGVVRYDISVRKKRDTKNEITLGAKDHGVTPGEPTRPR